jgi:dihydrofolate reductase
MISHIVACSDNNVIGADGELPWQLPGDLKRFYQITSNRIVIMGRKTYESIGKPLPNRVNIVISRQTHYNAAGCLNAMSLEDALKAAEFTDEEVFIIGGGEIYKQSMDIIDTIYMTKVYGNVEGDAFYPDIPNDFEETAREDLIGYSYITYRRRNVEET